MLSCRIERVINAKVLVIGKNATFCADLPADRSHLRDIQGAALDFYTLLKEPCKSTSFTMDGVPPDPTLAKNGIPLLTCPEDAGVALAHADDTPAAVALAKHADATGGRVIGPG